ncbi:MAG: MG2 domain-containing protein [Deltaproteobacteria bacterium]|jgi:uncharacterized protein YfaS (alpha-2-macroglobulin family)
MNRLATYLVLAAALLACGEKEEDPLREVEPERVRVTRFEPQSAALVTRPIDVTFSTQLVGPSEVGIDVPAENLLVISPAIAGRARWTAQDTLRFIPEESFADGARYRVTLRPGVVGEGRVLAGSGVFEFPTRMFTLASIEVRPRAEAQTARVVLEFTHPVRPAEASAAVSFSHHDGRTIRSRILTAGVGRLMTFLIGPMRQPFENVSADVRVDASLRAVTGGRPLEKTIVRPVALVPEPVLKVVGADAFQTNERLGVRVRLNRAVDAPAIRNVLTINPPVVVDVESWHHTFEIRGAFKSGQTYTMSLDAGVRSADGFRLAERATFTVKMPSLAPALRLVRETGPVELRSVNVSRVDVRVTKIWDDNVAHLLPHLASGTLPDAETFGTVVYRSDLETAGRIDEVVSTIVPYVDPHRRRAGLYLVEVVDTERLWVRANTWVFDDGLTLTAKVGASAVRAEVLSQSNLRPVYAAEVRVVSRTNRTLGTSRTQPNGVAQIGVDWSAEDPPAWVIARRGTSFAYLPLPATRAVPEVDDGEDVRGRAHLFLDRSTFRAGETVRLGMLVRDDALKSATWTPSLEVKNPLGERLKVERVERTIDGASVHTIALPVSAPRGRYEVRALDGNGWAVGRALFWVDASKPPRLAVDVRVDEGTTGPRAPAFVVRGGYRLGQKPASGLVLRTRCRYVEQPVAFERHAGFAFRHEGASRLEIIEREVETRLDTSGEGRRWCPAVRSAGAAGPVRITLEAAVVEPGGRVVRDDASVVHRPTPHAVGVRRRLDAGPSEVGKDAALEAIVVGPDGEAVSGIAVVATIRSLDGSAAPVEVKLTSGAEPVAIPYVTREPGRHRVDVETTEGASTSTLFWVIPDVGSNVPAPGDELVVVAPGADVQVGDSASLLVWAPYEGQLELTIERDRVLWRTKVELDANVSRVEVPILPSFAPNAFAVARIVSGRRAAFAQAPLVVNTRRHRLRTALDVPARLTAQRDIEVGLRVEDEDGKPVTAHALVWIVDKRRTDPRFDAPADPVEHFVGLQPLSLVTHDLSTLYDGVQTHMSKPPRQRRPRVEWSDAGSSWSKIVTVEGAAKIPLRVPSMHGEARVAAVVFARDRFGAASRDTTVKDPLRLRTHAPQLLRPGDELEMPLEIENGLDRSIAVDLVVDTRGPLAVAERTKRLSIPADSSNNVVVRLKVDDAVGDARVALRGTAGTSSSSVERRFVVAPARTSTITGASLEVSRASPLTLALPKSFVRGSANASITVGPTVLWAHRAALDAVLAPSRESKLSATYEVLALTFAYRLIEDGDVRLRDALARLTASTGGRDEWATTLYGLALFEAARIRAVDRAATERAYQRLYAIVTSPSAEVEPRTRAVAHFVLALANRPDRRGLIELADAWDQADAAVDPIVRAMLAGALMRAGMLTRGRRMLADPIPIARGRSALLLAILADVYPFHPQVDGFLAALRKRAPNGYWASREENALALAAVGKFSRRAAPDPQYWGSLLIDGEVEKRFNTKRSAIVDAPLDAWRNRTLAFEVTGAGTAYVGLSVRGVATGDPKPRADGLALEHTLSTIAGAPIDGPVPYGELVVGRVTVRCTATDDCGRVRVDARMPAGLEIEDSNLTGLGWLELGASRPRSEATTSRVIYELDLSEREVAHAYYTARAIAVGSFSAPAVVASGAQGRRGVTAAGWLAVRAAR